MKKLIFLPILLLPILFYYLYPFNDGLIVFLTWEQEDTSGTMTVNYLTTGKFQTSLVYYDTTSHSGDPSRYRYVAYGSQRNYPGIRFTVHTTELRDLSPNNTYYFVVGDKKSGFSEERKFRTVPESGLIRFISGGDAGISKEFKEISQIATATEPHFVIMGGDIAYANGDITQQDTWKEFLKIWQHTMITPEGYTVPIIAAIGNHEINKSNWRLLDKAPFYYMLFKPNAEKTYFTRHIGLDNVLFILDTDHIHSSHGEQLDWMKQAFAEYSDSTFRFASYHSPLYPSFREPDAPSTKNLRRHWLPIFDQNRLQVAFENHEHALKKSWLLKDNKVVDTEGTYYLGDGNWGQVSSTPQERWFLETAEPVNHVWSVELDGDDASFKVLTIDGVDENYSLRLKASDNRAAKKIFR